MKILVVDVGGTNIKILATGQDQVRKIPSGPTMTPPQMVEGVKQLAADWEFDRVTIGYPGPVVHEQPLTDPHNLGPGWIGFDFTVHFGKPVKLINDAAMQALGSYEGGRMLFLGLGTGLGSALIVDNIIAPLELAHLPYRKRMTFEDYVGERGLLRLGKKKWRGFVADVANRLRAAMVADYVVIGGGNLRKLDVLPQHCRAGDNNNAFTGGFRLWEGPYHRSHSGSGEPHQ
jgi:polyphosphate glucokinase